MVESVVVLLFPAALVYAAVSDLASYQIPNWLSLAIVVDFVAAAVVGSLDIAAIGWHLSAGVAVLVAGMLLFARGIVGGGDAKLMAACAVWVGWSGLLRFCLVVAVIGGLFALLVVGLRRVELRPSWVEWAWLRRLRSAERGIPYGVAIGIAGVVMFKDLPLVASTASHEFEPWRTALAAAV